MTNIVKRHHFPVRKIESLLHNLELPNTEATITKECRAFVAFEDVKYHLNAVLLQNLYLADNNNGKHLQLFSLIKLLAGINPPDGVSCFSVKNSPDGKQINIAGFQDGEESNTVMTLDGSEYFFTANFAECKSLQEYIYREAGREPSIIISEESDSLNTGLVSYTTFLDILLKDFTTHEDREKLLAIISSQDINPPEPFCSRLFLLPLKDAICFF